MQQDRVETRPSMSNSRITRLEPTGKRLWRLGLLVGASALLAACGPVGQPVPVTKSSETARPTEAPKPAETKSASPSPSALAIAEAKPPQAVPAQAAERLSGTITADGSSTVFPLSEALAEEFQKLHPGVRVTVGISGTGGGFKKFCVGETQISNASRQISAAEKKACADVGIEYYEVEAAIDGIAVVTNRQTEGIDNLTFAELNRIWRPESQGEPTKWSQVRPGWPDRPITLFGPGADSGTFDYFTQAINGKEKSSRGDYTASEDDNTLVGGVKGTPYAIGYFGVAYFEHNSGQLVAIPILNDKTGEIVAPTPEAIKKGTYPLSRKVYWYVTKDALGERTTAEFMKFSLAMAPELAGEVGLVALPQEQYAASLRRLLQIAP